jgi:large-conductance mechanosensitive channel
MDLLIGIAIGTAFAPFWMMLYNKFIKPTVTDLWAKYVTKK